MPTSAGSKPTTAGISPSFGFGDRIGLSTPGHIAALRQAGLAGRVVPVFAQQSIRELARTGRSPEEVMAAARSAVEAADWTHSWVADADHLKTADDVQRMAEAGFTFFTADPSDFVDEGAGEVSGSALESVFDAVCGNCDRDPADFLDQYADRRHQLENLNLEITLYEAIQVGLVYLPAIEHVVRIYGWVCDAWQADDPFDFEVSVDETSRPTSPAAHFIIASELKRAGVRFTSLAPRFVGAFEKAVDFRGDLDDFETHLKHHAAIARVLGPYKLSVHSGSDKFAIYPVLHRYAGDLLHVKTAGTSYLEALRLMARHCPDMFRQLLQLAIEQFPQARATYALSTEMDKVPAPADVADAQLEQAYLDAPDADDPRQVLHVAFGSVLRHERFAPTLRELMVAHADEHAADLVRHFGKHLAAFGA